MAMDVGGQRGAINAHINVTPLVDVMLVLLIIMMLIAPMLQQGVAVTLPEAVNTRATSRTRRTRPSSPSTRINHFYVNAIPVSKDDLVTRVTVRARGQERKGRLSEG